MLRLGPWPIILLMIFLATGAVAQDPENRPARKGGPELPELSDEQKEKMKAIDLQKISEITPLRNQLMEKRTRLRSLISDQPFNEKEAFQVVDEMEKIESSILKIEIRNHQKIRAILNKEQQIIFDAKPVPFLRKEKR